MRAIIILTSLVLIILQILNLSNFYLLRTEFKDLAQIRSQLREFADIENSSACICIVPNPLEEGFEAGVHNQDGSKEHKYGSEEHKYNKHKL